MAFHLSLLFLCAKEKAVLTVWTADFSSKSFRPKGPKIFLATKSKNLGASWPQGFFFLKSSPVYNVAITGMLLVSAISAQAENPFSLHD